MSEYFDKLSQEDHLVLVNKIYNGWISDNADKDGEKAIPYMGWFWRNPNFHLKEVSLGKGDGLVGIMENNKWGYAERFMSEEEVDKFMDYIDQAREAMNRGGQVSKLIEEKDNLLKELRDWIQTLRDVGEWSDPE